jgi:hypothetical protein
MGTPFSKPIAGDKHHANMNIRFNTKVLPLLIVISFWVLSVPVSNASADPFLDGQMKLVESQIGRLQTMSYFLGALTLAVFIFGVVVGLLQKANSKGMKITASVLAFSSAVIVASTHQFFQADDRAYDKVAQQASIKLKDFAYQLALYPTLDDSTKAGLEKQFGELRREIDQLEYTTLHNAAPISSQRTSAFRQRSILISEARADQGAETTIHAPAWAEKLPVNEYNLYYLGAADGKTFQEAQDKALLNARTSAANAFVQTAAVSAQLAGNPDLIEELAKALGGSAEIAETFVAPNPGGGFRGYVLLRLSRSAAAFTARSVFVKTGAHYDAKFLDTINKEPK